MKNHGERKHAKLSASGAERWMNCPGSVALSEGLPDKDTIWAKEGTKAHEVLEALLLSRINGIKIKLPVGYNREMISHGDHAARFLLNLHSELEGSEILIETRVHLSFIHPEMFGTFDGAVIDHFGTLHVFDYKYGAGHAVSPKNNLQMIFYGMGLAAKYDWNFKKVRLWVIQPRIKGYQGPVFWEVAVKELQGYVLVFKAAVLRVEEKPNEYKEGGWCFFCKAKAICPLKNKGRLEKAKAIFTPV